MTFNRMVDMVDDPASRNGRETAEGCVGVRVSEAS
jgi:hypothetical protein